MILSECRKQARPGLSRRACAGNEPNIHRASFTERRLFYLNCHTQNNPLIPNPSPNWEGSPLSHWERTGVSEYKGL
jgi:hypothetical protein